MMKRKLMFFAILMCMGLSASAQSVTINVQNVSLKSILREITEQTSYTFNYSQQFVDVEQRVSLNVENESIPESLDVLLSGLNVGYVMGDKSIDLVKQQNSNNQSNEEIEITGEVISTSDGLPCLGATVLIKGTYTGTATDLDGKYSLKIPAGGAVLVYSYMGYVSQEISVGSSQTVVDVALVEAVTELDDVVVVGYGVVKKKLTTGANLNAKGEDIARLNTGSAMEALQGVAPGLSVSRTNGAPGAGTKVNIRGLGTVGHSSPLYIVDGVEVGSIDNINPMFIESIDVLKDAASAAIYGSRAANGVILVTTKKGKVNQITKVSYSGYAGVQSLAHKPSSLDAQEYMYIQDEMRINDGLPAVDWLGVLSNNTWLNTQSPDLGTEYGEAIWSNLQNGWTGTDWLSEITTEDAAIHSHAVNVTGGGSVSRFAVSVGYYNQQGLIGGDIADAGYERFNASFNSDIVFYKNAERDIVTFGENLSFTYSKNKGVANGGQYYNDVYDALRTSPLMPTHWSGSLDKSGIAPNLDGMNSAHINPLSNLYYNRGRLTDNNNNSIVGNVYLSVKPIEGLEIRSSYGMNVNFNNTRSYTPMHSGFGDKKPAVTEDQVNQGMNQYTSYTWSNTINYDKEIGKHDFGVLIGNEINRTTNSLNLSAWAKGSIFNDFNNAYLQNVPKPSNPLDFGYSGVDWSAQGGGIASFMSRLSYSYDDKYMAVVTMRADGSSAFAKGNRWGYFPSISAGWNFSEEELMKNCDWLSFGKLRASWGQNGNQTLKNSRGQSVGFVYSSNVSTDEYGYYFGSSKPVRPSISYPSNVPNPDITWETSEQLNFGLDLTFLDTRLGVTLDWYNKTTKDWLVVAPIQGTFGAGAPFINGGEIRNMGTELTLRWRDEIGDFSYGANVSLASNKNNVTQLDSAAGFIESATAQIFDSSAAISRVEVGMPIGFFYGYQTDGVLQNQAEVDAYVNADGVPYFEDARPGDVRFVDYNKDGVIDDSDKTMIGDPNPDLQLGIQLNVAYKGAYANVTAAGKFGHQVFNTYFWGEPTSVNEYRNWTTEIFDRWHGEGTSNTLPRLSSQSHRNTNYVSDIYVRDADYLRISNLTVGYNFAYLFKDKNWLENMSVYFAVNNLCTFTAYDGLDPDVSYGGANAPWASGVDLGLYPLPRTVMLGANISF